MPRISLSLVATLLLVTSAASATSASPDPCAAAAGCIAFANLDLSRDPPKYDLYVVGADGSRLRRLTHSATASDFSPSWSPDGTEIAYRHETSFDGDNLINVIDADGSNVRQLREGISPSWSPNGKKIAFAGASEGPGTDIFVMDPDGTNVRRLTRTPGQIDEYPAWSPDSRRIVYASTQGVAYASESRALWVMNADGSRKRQLTRGSGDMYPAWSPNGRTIAFQTRRGLSNIRQKTVFTMTPAGKRFHRVAKCLCDHPAWSPDSKHLAVEHYSGGIGILSLRQRKTLRVIARGIGEPGFPAWRPRRVSSD